ncbi:MAG: leucine-rich repeat domain-containing protein, partial [Oscillospiraceae bacterium]|nr:leucine-rich repeat domain-containing protein [Oscillospiraceae bacterium]
MIQYASDNGKTESTAWLLDFKNRTADLAAERKRAEKKAERELNADPNSLSEIKKVWKFEKQESSDSTSAQGRQQSNPGGTVIVTGYKGDSTDVIVPEKICGDTVTAIGKYAFSPNAERLRKEQRALREAITKVTLPDTIESIGEFAFCKCKSLTEINFPKKLTKISKGMFEYTGFENIVIEGHIKRIGSAAFYVCRALKHVKLCEGVAEIGSGAFYNCTELETIELPRSLERVPSNVMPNAPFWKCHKLTALVHKGSYAETYCKENNIAYKYKDEE